MVNENLCIGCGACASLCPVGAIKVSGGKANIDPKKCIKCGSCAQFCPVGAIDLNAPANEVKKDEVKKETKSKPSESEKPNK